MAVLQSGQLPHPRIELAVGDRGRVQHVVAPTRIIELLGQLGMSFPGCSRCGLHRGDDHVGEVGCRVGARIVNVWSVGVWSVGVWIVGVGHANNLATTTDTAARRGLDAGSAYAGASGQRASSSPVISAASRNRRSSVTAGPWVQEASPQAGLRTRRSASTAPSSSGRNIRSARSASASGDGT